MNRHSIATTVARIVIGIAVIYVLLCAVSLLLIAATGAGWLGLEPDPFVAIYAVALALPWVFFVPEMTILGSYAGVAAILLGMLINLALLLGLGRWLGRRGRFAEP